MSGQAMLVDALATLAYEYGRLLSDFELYYEGRSDAAEASEALRRAREFRDRGAA